MPTDRRDIGNFQTREEIEDSLCQQVAILAMTGDTKTGEWWICVEKTAATLLAIEH